MECVGSRAHGERNDRSQSIPHGPITHVACRRVRSPLDSHGLHRHSRVRPRQVALDAVLPHDGYVSCSYTFSCLRSFPTRGLTTFNETNQRFLITFDESGELLPATVRVGQAVDVVGQAGKPRTISGFQTHQTPVRLGHRERAEMATEEYLPYSHVLEGCTFSSSAHCPNVLLADARINVFARPRCRAGEEQGIRGRRDGDDQVDSVCLCLRGRTNPQYLVYDPRSSRAAFSNELDSTRLSLVAAVSVC